MATINRIRHLRVWKIIWILAVLVAAAGAGYTAYARATSVDDQALGENQQLFNVAYGDLVNQVSTNGTLVFPEKETMNFGTEGIVNELLVEEGQQVEKGEVLARLDLLTIARLEQEEAQAKVDLQSMQALLEETRQGYTLLERAQQEEVVADAYFQIQEAQEVLDDAREPHTEQQIQSQEKMLAEARVAVRNALGSLSELSPDNSLRYAGAVEIRASANAALEASQRELAEFEINHAQLRAETIQTKADWEVILVESQATLDAYEENAPLLHRWRNEKEEAQESLENSQNILANLLVEEARVGGLRSHIRTREEFLEIHLHIFDQAQENLVEVERLEADILLARASIDSIESDLEQLKLGPDPLHREELEAAVQLAEADLLVAEESLSNQRLEVDPLDASLLESQLALARAAVAQAEEDLKELYQGADALEIVLRESQLRTAQAALFEASQDLKELLAGPEPMDLALAKAEVAAVKQELEDTNTRLIDSTLRAPFAGVISALYVEEGDQVGARAAILDLSNPTWVEVDGIVDEVDVLSLRKGIRAEVSLDALPGRRFEGTLTEIAPEALSQQGVVSYPIRISLELPRHMQPREGLSAVANIVLREERNVLRVPQQALQGSFEQPVVKVKTPSGLEERGVTLGDTDGYWVAVKEGLQEGEVVVVQSADVSTSRFSFRQFRGGHFGGSAGGSSGRTEGGSGRGSR